MFNKFKQANMECLQFMKLIHQQNKNAFTIIQRFINIHFNGIEGEAPLASFCSVFPISLMILRGFNFQTTIFLLHFLKH